MANIAVSASNTREERGANSAPLTAALLKLLNEAEVAVDRDRDAARFYLARATALLLADGSRGDLARVGEGEPRGGFPRWQAKRLIAHIDANLGVTISCADLIGLTGVSTGHFFRTFKATFGDAPFAYIAQRRIERAQQLMLTTSLPLCQIALDCGLCDQSHFTRLFRRLVGVTPRAWRREHARCQPHTVETAHEAVA